MFNFDTMDIWKNFSWLFLDSKQFECREKHFFLKFHSVESKFDQNRPIYGQNWTKTIFFSIETFCPTLLQNVNDLRKNCRWLNFLWKQRFVVWIKSLLIASYSPFLLPSVLIIKLLSRFICFHQLCYYRRLIFNRDSADLKARFQ